MKILVLSVSAGQGHHQTAAAAVSYLEERGAECFVLDALKYINPVIGESVSRGYLMSTKYSPDAYGYFYRMAEKNSETSKNRISRLTNTFLSRKLVNYIEELSPDAVICTHVFAGQLLTYVCKKISKKILTLGVITDFTIHPYWEATNMDYYVTASELLTNQAVNRGLQSQKIKPFGIPIHPKFGRKRDKSEARRILNLPDKKTVLVMSGSMGFGKVKNTILELNRSKLDFQIVSICGNNKRLKRTIDNMDISKEVFNCGFVDNVEVFMDASDCIVTKPGGLTTSESLAKGLPMLLSNPIPGQEDRNVEFLLNNGAAALISPSYPADEAIYQLFSNKVRQEILRTVIASIGKPNSARDLGEFILENLNVK